MLSFATSPQLQHRLTLGLLALLIVNGFITSFLSIAVAKYEASHKLKDHSYYGQDIPEVVPSTFSPAAMIIFPSDHYPLTDDAAWASSLAPKRGFIRLGPRGRRPFGISLYHQLHCVNGVRFTYMIAKERYLTDPEKLRSDLGHISHCFQFLRQSVLCRADTTLIPVAQGQNATTFPEAANPRTHRCRDWTQVREFVVQNHERWEDISLPPPDEPQ